MASLGHFAVGMAAARVSNEGERASWRSMAGWSALSMLPDADVVAFAFGIAHEDPWGHRGATHSFVFATAIGAIAAIVAARFGLPRAKTWVIASLVVASHALLDTLTDGWLGCALFWPFDLTRYFAPWRPIPVSPLGLEIFSPYGAFVVSTELILFSPLFVYALRSASKPRRARARVAWSLVWLVALWLIGSQDPWRQGLVAAVLREQTEYAPGFSERAFASVERGMSEADVAQLLGVPFEQWWQYSDTPGNAGSLSSSKIASSAGRTARISRAGSRRTRALRIGQLRLTDACSEAPRNARADRRIGDDPLVALNANHHPDIAGHAEPPAQRHLHAAAEEEHTGAVGGRPREILVDV